MTDTVTSYDIAGNDWKMTNDYNELFVRQWLDILMESTWKRIASFKGCGLWLKDGTDIACKVIAEDELGNCTVMTIKNECRQYLTDEIL